MPCKECFWGTDKPPVRLGRIGVEQKTVPMLELKTPKPKVPYCRLLAAENHNAQCAFPNSQTDCPQFLLKEENKI